MWHFLPLGDWLLLKEVLCFAGMEHRGGIGGGVSSAAREEGGSPIMGCNWYCACQPCIKFPFPLTSVGDFVKDFVTGRDELVVWIF